jgi:adenylate cyclase class IV
LDISIGDVMQKILAAGGELTFHGEVVDTYYYFTPEQGRKLDESIRIRTKNNSSYLTIKQKNTSSTIKDRQEREVHLPSPAEYENLFIAM